MARLRMEDLEDSGAGVKRDPYRLVLYGVDGVGKTTFAAEAPNPIFLGPENGTARLKKKVKRFPTALKLADIQEAIRFLKNEKHPFQSLIIDTLDWLEPIVWQSFLVEGQTIEKYDGGYGAGYAKALNIWRSLLVGLADLQEKTGINVLLLAHMQVKNYKNPVGEDYDRIILKLHEKTAALIREWASGVYFATHDDRVIAEGKGKAARKRGVSGGRRLMYCHRQAAFDAKDRYGMPERPIELSWDAFVEYAENGSVKLEALAAECKRKAELIGGNIQHQTKDVLEKHKTIAKLTILNNRLNVKLAEMKEEDDDEEECDDADNGGNSSNHNTSNDDSNLNAAELYIEAKALAEAIGNDRALLAVEKNKGNAEKLIANLARLKELANADKDYS